MSNNYNSNHIISVISAIILILFISLIAPKLPKSLTKYLENPIFILIIFILIAYITSKDIIIGIIAIIALLICYQTLSAQKITDNVIHKTQEIINSSNKPPTYDLTNNDVIINQSKNNQTVNNKLTYNKNLNLDNSTTNAYNLNYTSNSNTSTPIAASLPNKYNLDVNTNNCNDTRLGRDNIIMNIDDNHITLNDKIIHERKSSKKLLQDNTIPNNYLVDNEYENTLGNTEILTDLCPMKHTSNYNCGNLINYNNHTDYIMGNIDNDKEYYQI